MDEAILLFVNGNHAEWADVLMWHISAKLTWVPLYLLLAVMLWRKLGWHRTLIAIIALALFVVLADQTCSHIIRPLVCRLRPSNPDNPLSEMIHLVNDYHGGPYGMPSCHAANTLGFATLYSLILRRKVVAALLFVWAIAQCYSRMYLGVHYPTDLLAGAAVGIAWAVVVYLFYKKIVSGKRI